MKATLQRMKARLFRLLERLKEQYEKLLGRHLSKLAHRLTHNKVLFVEHNRWLFFNRFSLKITYRRREATLGYLFILLWIIGYLIFALYPIFYSLYLSFFNVRLDGASINLTFVGIGNYRAAFLEDPFFVEILVNYILRMLLNVPVTIVFALIIAMLINQDVKGKGVWRTIFFLPVIISSGPVIGELMNQGATTLPTLEEFSFVQLVLNNLSDFFANPIQTLFDQILLVLWFAGIQILILLAGLQKINREVYEAAQIDGASPWEAFWKITLPSIMPLVNVVIIYTIVSMSVFSLNDVIIYIRGIMLGLSTPALTTGYGYSATLAWIFFLSMSLIILLFVGMVSLRFRKVRT